MKRLFLMTLAMLTMTLAKAEDENAANVVAAEAYELNINMNRLGTVLELNEDQKESVEYITNVFTLELKMAAQASADERQALVDKAVKKDVRFMHYILNNKQYRKYLTLLNLTLQNRGLK